ncbi:peptide-methionine (S)-S-oxide reductase MsrA [Thalassospira sp.]|uniref:peptide-methionine (S)-S-oxide reductase MsrA n=1 Tax=Thalassospira sp. TaxID=1912094 RepID=UPI0025DD2431|nr:peptide-methionine (S)-S-oxide reductase MsrA [Thalassospira sp.]
MMSRNRTGWKILSAGVLALAAIAVVVIRNAPAISKPTLIPPPITDIEDRGGSQTAFFAGGCFWGMQGIFQHVEGVTRVVSGYIGGSAETATYEQTETGRTGHAEAVQVVFDPDVVSYGQLLQIFFSVAHDPTQLDRQGQDVGTQYRSAIFPANDAQGNVSRAYITQLDGAGVFGSRIATRVEPGKVFYPAESYHQNYLYNHPTQPYIALFEQPKIDKFKEVFPELYRDEPVLLTH